MARKKKQSVNDIVNAMSQSLSAKLDTPDYVPYVPDIMTFCDDEQYLGLRDGPNPTPLYPIQRIVLKAFYRGSRGNEHITLSEEERDLCREMGLDTDMNGNILKKVDSENIFKELVLIWGRRCLSEDATLIDPTTGREWTLGEAWDYGKTEWMSWTLDERTGDMVCIPNCSLIYQGVRPVYRLATASGHEIEATDNHPFLTQRGWIQLKDIRVGEDKVALAASVPFFGNSDAISEDEAAILGYMTGDGNCSQRATFFTCANEAVLADFKERVARVSSNLRVFNDPWTGAKSKKYQYKITAAEKRYESFKKPGVSRTFTKQSENDLVKLLTKHGLMGKTCHHKSVPKALYECPKNVIAAYLRSLFSCDGSIHVKKGCSVVEIEFYTVNKKQAVAVRGLLARFGIFASVRAKRSKTTIGRENTSYDSLSYRVAFSRRDYVVAFLQNVGFVGKDDRVRASLDLLSQEQTKAKSTNAIHFSNVKAIELVGEKRTFDLQVSDNPQRQNFVSSCFTVHNSGKDFMASIVALYEAMKLLEVPGGNPHAYYNVGGAQPISILTIACTAGQAAIAFREIREKLLYSKYFQDKIEPEAGVLQNQIYLLTPKDKKDNEAFRARGMPIKPGSVCIEVGNSNSDGLLGKGCFVMILDEVASYKTGTGGAGSGERIYTALTPMINTYIRQEPLLDEYGNKVLDEKGDPVLVNVYDGKIVSISSPRGKEGKLWELYETAHLHDDRLLCKLPTWCVNPKQQRDRLRKSQSTMSDAEFAMEFGAEFSGTEGESMFPIERVKECFNHGIVNRVIGQPGYTYFAHLDPATSSHNYALVVCHREVFLDVEAQKSDFRIVVDHIQYWAPSGDRLIEVAEVDEYMIDLKKRFRLGLVSYDQWNSAASIQKLRKNGIPAILTRFNRSYKMRIYTELENLIISGRLWIPRHEVLFNEMIELQRKYDGSGGFKIYPKKEGDGQKSDDICDALAGSVFLALASDTNRLPKSRLAALPLSPQGNDVVWKSMQGVPYGIGPGERVAKQLERRNSWPNYKR